MKREREFDIEIFEEEWSCPITRMPMKKPVILEDGHSYEEEELKKWLIKKKFSPKTNLKLKMKEPIPNRALQNVIEKYETEVKYYISKLKTEKEELEEQLNSSGVINYKNQLDEMKEKYKNFEEKSNVIEEFNKLKEENQKIKQNLNSLTIEFGDLKKINEENKKWKDQYFEMRSKYEILNKEMEKTNKTIIEFKMIKMEFEVLKSDHEEANKRILKLNSENESLLSQKLQLKGEKDWIQIQYEQMNREHLKCLKMKEDCMKSEPMKKEKKDELMQHSPASTCDKEKTYEDPTKLELTKALKTIKDLQEENDTLNLVFNPKEENEKKIAELMKKLQQKKREAEILTLEKTKLTRTIEDFKNSQINYESSKKQYESEIFKITYERAEIQKERLRIENSEIEKKKTKRIERLELENHIILESNTEKYRKIEKLESEFKKLNQEKVKILSQLNTQMTSNSNLTNEVSKKTINIQSLNQELGKLRRQLEICEQENKKLKSDLSKKYNELNIKEEIFKQHNALMNTSFQSHLSEQKELGKEKFDLKLINKTSDNKSFNQPEKSFQSLDNKISNPIKTNFVNNHHQMSNQKLLSEPEIKQNRLSEQTESINIISQPMREKVAGQIIPEKLPPLSQEMIEENNEQLEKVERVNLDHHEREKNEEHPELTKVIIPTILSSPKIVNILPYEDYLMCHPVLFNKKKLELNHSQHKVLMEEFLIHNWSELKIINFRNCQIENREFEMLTNQAENFVNLQYLLLWNNLITDLPNGCFERFPNLKGVYLSVERGLNERSETYLNSYKDRKPKVEVIYHKY